MKFVTKLTPAMFSLLGAAMFVAAAGPDEKPAASGRTTQDKLPRKEKQVTDDVSKTETKKDLVITRVFDAPVEIVWKAWTDPQQVMKWWGPTGFTCPSAKLDVREGGTSIVCMRAPKELGGQDMYSTWIYTKIVPMERIEYIHNLSDKDGTKADPAKLGMPPDFPKDQRHVVAFKKLTSGKTELTITEYGWTIGKMIELSELGMNQCLDKMAACFAKPNK